MLVLMVFFFVFGFSGCQDLLFWSGGNIIVGQTLTFPSTTRFCVVFLREVPRKLKGFSSSPADFRHKLLSAPQHQGKEPWPAFRSLSSRESDARRLVHSTCNLRRVLLLGHGTHPLSNCGVLRRKYYLSSGLSITSSSPSSLLI